MDLKLKKLIWAYHFLSLLKKYSTAVILQALGTQHVMLRILILFHSSFIFGKNIL